MVLFNFFTMFSDVGKIILPQWFAGIGVTLLLIHLGAMGGWASPTLARLTAEDSPILLSPEQASWVASLVNFSRFFGGILGAASTNYLGSKRSIFVTAFPIGIGWMAVAFADAAEWLYASRLFSGLGLGMAFAIFPLYLGEVSMPRIRGALISLASVGAPFGQVIASVCGAYMSVSAASYIYLALAILLMAIFWWLPESPHHLVKVGQRKAARDSINWYRSGKEVDDELTNIEKFVAAEGIETFCESFQEFKNPAIRRATMQIIVLFTFGQLCGLNIIMFFMETILIQAKFTLISPFLVVIYVNLCSICAAAISIPLIDRCGRRFLLLVSSVGTTTSLVGLVCHFRLLNMGEDMSNLQWIPITSVFLFMSSYFVGMFQVQNAILSETFPANIKCVASCIAILTGAAMSFLSAKTYQPMVDTMGDTNVFVVYTICSFIIIPYTLFVMPETKGKSLQQIQDELIK